LATVRPPKKGFDEIHLDGLQFVDHVADEDCPSDVQSSLSASSGLILK
jgi:hypothetical protein